MELVCNMLMDTSQTELERSRFAYTVRVIDIRRMRPISNDLRRRIIETIQENEETQPEIAERFSVSLSFVEKLRHRFRVTGSYEAKPH